jgi:hypothetical protein
MRPASTRPFEIEERDRRSRSVIYGHVVSDVIHASTAVVPMESTTLEASGGIRFAELWCMRYEMSESAGFPGTTSSAPVIPRLPSTGFALHAFVCANVLE